MYVESVPQNISSFPDDHQHSDVHNLNQKFTYSPLHRLLFAFHTISHIRSCLLILSVLNKLPSPLFLPLLIPQSKIKMKRLLRLGSAFNKEDPYYFLLKLSPSILRKTNQMLLPLPLLPFHTSRDLNKINLPLHQTNLMREDISSVAELLSTTNPPSFILYEGTWMGKHANFT